MIVLYYRWTYPVFGSHINAVQTKKAKQGIGDNALINPALHCSAFTSLLSAADHQLIIAWRKPTATELKACRHFTPAMPKAFLWMLLTNWSSEWTSLKSSTNLLALLSHLHVLIKYIWFNNYYEHFIELMIVLLVVSTWLILHQFTCLLSAPLHALHAYEDVHLH